MNYLASRAALALVGVFCVSGCWGGPDADDRVCPAGEICSTRASNGLVFQGALLSDGFVGSPLTTTAVGGTQAIKVLVSSAAGTATFGEPFDAVSSDVDVAAIGSREPPNVVMIGNSAGTTQLRLLEPGTESLLDRVEVRVAPVDRITLVPRAPSRIAAEGSPWALLAGAKANLVVALASADGTRLVDDSLSLTLASGSADRRSWDLFEVSAPAAGEASFTVTAAKSTFDIKVPVVAVIDDITLESSFGPGGADGKIEAGHPLALCFLAFSGTVATVGVQWKFSGSSTIELSVLEADTDVSNCVVVESPVGPAQLTIDASGFSKVFDLDFVKKTG